MSPSQESFDPYYFEPLYAAEERHFWFIARNKVICSLANNALKNQSDSQILEIGCGTGNVLQALEKNFPTAQLVGMDLFREGLQFARRRVKGGLVQADLAFPPFDRLFDLVGMFDVLEHIQDDQIVLNQTYQMIKPGGWLLLTVPADPRLWSYFDIASHHVRRYTLQELREKVGLAGFLEKFSSAYVAATYPLFWLNRRAMDYSISGVEADIQKQAEKEFKVIPIINEILCGVLSLEARWLSKGNRLPFGSSLVLLARKPVILP